MSEPQTLAARLRALDTYVDEHAGFSEEAAAFYGVAVQHFPAVVEALERDHDPQGVGECDGCSVLYRLRKALPQEEE